MANPQTEDGHVDIANEIIEHLAQIRLSGEEVQVLWVIFRKTYGWHKKADAISLGQFSEMTGLSRQHVLRAIKKLLPKMVIGVSKNGNRNINIFEFNKDFDQWRVLPKKGTVTNNGNKVYPKMGTKVLPKKVHTKEKKETIQKKNTYMDFVKLTTEEHSKLVTQFGDKGTLEWIDTLNTYIGSKGKRYKSHYFTILDWSRRVKQKQGEYL